MTQKLTLDFIGVGAAKSGTTWLTACLAAHPQLCIAELGALNYFCERAIWPELRISRNLGPQWLSDRFVHCKPGQLLGEFSPNYLCDPESPALIHQHNPDCRLIFCFRHPVEALASFYYQVLKETPVADTFARFLEDHPEMRRVGLYHLYARRYLEVFPREQCLFLLHDDIERDPSAVLRSCYSFLRVDRDFVPAAVHERVNERQIPRSKAMLAGMNWARHFLQKHTAKPHQQALIWKWKLHRCRHGCNN